MPKNSSAVFLSTRVPRMEEWIDFPAHHELRRHIDALNATPEVRQTLYFICLVHLARKKCQVQHIVSVTIAILREYKRLHPRKHLIIQLSIARKLADVLIDDAGIIQDVHALFDHTTDVPDTNLPSDHLFS